MGDRLVVRWVLPARIGNLNWMLAMYACVAALYSREIDDVALRVVILIVGFAVLVHVLLGLRSRHVLDAAGWSSIGRYRSRTVSWSNLVEIRWFHDVGMYGTGGRKAMLRHVDGSGRMMQPVAERRTFDVNAWLRANQPDVLIDPKPPWQDRFGGWHVEQLGPDPVETMMSVRRSHVGPWEITAMSCEGGFRAQQRVVHGGALVEECPVRETLAEAKADGVQLVRAALDASASAHE